MPKHLGRRPTPQVFRSARRLLPLERDHWSCVDEHGNIRLTAHLATPDWRGRFTTALSVWDPDDTGHDRWWEHPDLASAEAAYQRLVEVVSRAPNPLPMAWIQIQGLTRA